MSLITINGIGFGSGDMAISKPEAYSSFSENSLQALQFCRAWLSGQQEFTMHTSGSVGKPKAVVLGREQIKLSVQLTAKALGLKKGMNVLVCLPAAYIAGMMMLARTLELDMNATVVEPAGNPLEGIEIHHDFEFVSLVPMQLHRILQRNEDRQKLERFRHVLIGGAALSAELEEEINSLTPAFYHTYGMTETASHIALRRLNGENSSGLFYPLEGVEISLDERDCLLIKGAITGNETLATNDLAEINEGGFRILGRIDNTINTGGVKVQVEKIESAIEKALDKKVPFFVSSMPDAILGEKVIAVFLSGIADQGFAWDLKKKLEMSLSRFEIPGKIMEVEEFIYTPSGKINRKATMELLKNT